MTFSKLPAIVILYYVALGLSGIFTTLGLIKYRGMIYGVFCR